MICNVRKVIDLKLPQYVFGMESEIVIFFNKADCFTGYFIADWWKWIYAF